MSRWDFYYEFLSFAQRFSDMFEDLTPKNRREPFWGGIYEPPVDAYENEDEIVVEVEIPGMDQKNIEIRLENNILIIKGARNIDENATKGNFYRIERTYGNFIRTLNLPDLIDKDGISATYLRGVLTVSLPKSKKNSIMIEVK